MFGIIMVFHCDEIFTVTMVGFAFGFQGSLHLGYGWFWVESFQYHLIFTTGVQVIPNLKQFPNLLAFWNIYIYFWKITHLSM